MRLCYSSWELALGSPALKSLLKHKITRGVRYIGMVFGIVGSQPFNNAKPFAAEMVGSAFKIIHTNHRPDYIHQLGSKGATPISGN